MSGEAKDVLQPWLKEHKVGCLVTDMSPLRVPRKWVDDVAKQVKEDNANMPFYQVCLCEINKQLLVSSLYLTPILR